MNVSNAAIRILESKLRKSESGLRTYPVWLWSIGTEFMGTLVEQHLDTQRLILKKLKGDLVYGLEKCYEEQLEVEESIIRKTRRLEKLQLQLLKEFLIRVGEATESDVVGFSSNDSYEEGYYTIETGETQTWNLGKLDFETEIVSFFDQAGDYALDDERDHINGVLTDYAENQMPRVRGKKLLKVFRDFAETEDGIGWVMVALNQ